LLQDNLPKESETNQPLTSDAVHEDLHYDNPIYDQWDVEPYSALTGSYVDLVITGSMIPDGARGVVSSAAAGQAGTTGSLQRFVRLTDSVGKLYDSYPPDVGSILINKGYGAGTPSNLAAAAVFPGTPDLGFSTRGIYPDWYLLNDTYQLDSIRLLSEQFFQTPIEVYNAGDSLVGTRISPIKETYIAVDTGLVGAGRYITDEDGNRFTDSANKNAKRSLWGFGNNKFNAPTFRPPENAPSSGWVPVIRGYKYGLAGLFGSSLDIRYRRDRYGQFRDMLEQRRYPAILVNNSVEYPIEIAFIERDSTTGGTVDPLQTHSQNLDTHASSSMPYFDGLTVDRSDNPDETLVPVEVS